MMSKQRYTILKEIDMKHYMKTRSKEYCNGFTFALLNYDLIDIDQLNELREPYWKKEDQKFRIFTKKQRELLWQLINNAQGNAVKFFIKYESGMLIKEPSKELTEWYEESKKEFKELQKVKEMLE